MPLMGTYVKAANKDTLIVASGADAVTLDPGVSFDGQSPLLWRNVYEALLDYKEDTLEFVPLLAESFATSDDQKNYTFKIRKGVEFTDGEVLNAAAVKFNIERQIKVNRASLLRFLLLHQLKLQMSLPLFLSLASRWMVLCQPSPRSTR